VCPPGTQRLTQQPANQTFDLLIEGGTVIDPAQTFTRSQIPVGDQERKIAEVSKDIPKSGPKGSFRKENRHAGIHRLTRIVMTASARHECDVTVTRA